MPQSLYIGNLAPETTKEDLESLFGPYGPISNIHVPMDRVTGAPRGFAFVELSDNQAAERAIQDINGQDLHQRKLVVNPARPKTDRPGGGGGGGPSPYNKRRRF